MLHLWRCEAHGHLNVILSEILPIIYLLYVTVTGGQMVVVDVFSTPWLCEAAKGSVQETIPEATDPTCIRYVPEH